MGLRRLPARVIGEEVEQIQRGSSIQLRTMEVYQLQCGHRTKRPKTGAAPSKTLGCKSCTDYDRARSLLLGQGGY